jgi:hypothetical protein
MQAFFHIFIIKIKMSSKSTLMLPILKEILMKEIGEANLTPLDWKQVSPNKYKFLVDINDFTEVVTVDFEEGDDVEKQYYLPPKYRRVKTFYNVAYEVSGNENQFDKTDSRTLLQILSTVVNIIEDFISKNKPEILQVAASEKNIGKGDNLQKLNLYKAYIRKSLEKNTEYNSMLGSGGILIVSKEI